MANHLMPTTADYFGFSEHTMNVVNDKTGLTHEEEFCAERTEKSMLAYMSADTMTEALHNAFKCVVKGFEDIIILRSVVRNNFNYYVLCQRKEEK